MSAYSLSPVEIDVDDSVPMHPRSRPSFLRDAPFVPLPEVVVSKPRGWMFHVTKSGQTASSKRCTGAAGEDADCDDVSMK